MRGGKCCRNDDTKSHFLPPDVPLFLTPLINAGKIDEARRASRVQLAGPAVESYAGYLTVNQVDCGSNLVKNGNAKP